MGRVILYIFLFLIWSAISWRWYTCGVKNQCAWSPNHASSVEEEEQNYVLAFELNDAEPIIGKRWISKLDSVLSRGKDNQVLYISGPYYSAERVPTGYENMGLARATEVSHLLDDSLHIDIELESHQMPESALPIGSWEGLRFEWLSRNENVQATMKGAMIYFPYKSDEKLSNENIISYLDDLAASLRKNEQKVEIIGHTDDVGSETYNEQLGLDRAKSIRFELVARGVPISRVEARSAGETEPIATNDTEEGREKNRRTEIKLN